MSQSWIRTVVEGVLSRPYGGSVLQEWYEGVHMDNVMVIHLQLEGSHKEVGGRKGS